MEGEMHITIVDHKVICLFEFVGESMGLHCVGSVALLVSLYHNLVFSGIDERPIMAKNTSVTLGDHFDNFIANQVDSGRYGSASEVIRAALRLLEDSEAKLQAVRGLLDEGEQSGVADYSYSSFIEELDSDS